MKESKVSRSTISRIPLYLQCLKSREFTKNISATVIARELGLGDVQVRKDLSAVCGAGRPKTGYDTEELVASLERFLGYDRKSQVVLVGAGKLGRALLDYGGFREYGLEIGAAFDIAVRQMETSAAGKPVYPMDQLEEYIRQHQIRAAIIAVPSSQAQAVCDRLVANRIIGILSFAPCRLTVPDNVCLQKEDMALSLAFLNSRINMDM
ncbi:MAG: redox-sensing transcriptional repressor Rex [Candidatus Limiplasma sp.]|nr:redox-sensing transcriptional repressor Rex [Clostridiales bacterium]MDY3817214.1 redox-sensing transcriptional repressor Rex [Candidatus Limiplasma sp.]